MVVERDLSRYVAQQLFAHDATLITRSVFELWVDAATGSDTNTGSASSPLATMIEAERRIPLIIQEPVFIRVKTHPGAGYTAPTFRPRVYGESIYVIGLDTTVLFEDVIQSAGVSSITATATLSASTYRGKTLEIIDGASATTKRIIQDNTTSVITPCVGISPAPTAGASYRITSPAVHMVVPAVNEHDSTKRWFVGYGGILNESGIDSNPFDRPGLYFINFVVDVTENSYIHLDGQVVFYGLEINGSFFTTFTAPIHTSYLQFGVSHLHSASSAGADTGMLFGATDIKSWLGWGIGSSSSFAFLKLSCHGYGLVAPTTSIWGARSVIVHGFNLYTSGLDVHGDINGSSFVRFSGKVAGIGDVQGLLTRAATATLAAATATGVGAYLELTKCTATHNASGLGVLSDLNANVRVTNDVVISAVNGTGVRARRGGEVTYLSGLSITATTELSVGQTPTNGTLAGLTVSGAYVGELDRSVIRRS